MPLVLGIAMRSVPATSTAPWPLPEPSRVKIPGAANCITLGSAADVPVPLWMVNDTAPPASACGHWKFTWASET